MQKAKEASVIGVVVATLGVKAFRDVIDHVCRIIDESGRKRYVFAVGVGEGGGSDPTVQSVSVHALPQFRQIARQLV